MKIPLLTVLGILILSSFAIAQDCKNPRDMVEKKSCAEARFIAADTEVKDVFERFVADSTKPAATKKDSKKFVKQMQQEDALVRRHLFASQKAWLQSRDAYCSAIEASVGAGTSHALARSECMELLTKKRIREIQEVLEPLLNGKDASEIALR